MEPSIGQDETGQLHDARSGRPVKVRFDPLGQRAEPPPSSPQQIAATFGEPIRFKLPGKKRGGERMCGVLTRTHMNVGDRVSQRVWSNVSKSACSAAGLT